MSDRRVRPLTETPRLGLRLVTHDLFREVGDGGGWTEDGIHGGTLEGDTGRTMLSLWGGVGADPFRHK